VDYRRSPSAACIRLIRDFEGLSLTAYRCAAGVWTIGYGHTEGVKIGDRVTGIKAEVMLREDLDDTAARVAHLLRRPVKQGQFDALVSFAFNVGAGALESSTLLQRLNAGDIEGAAEEFIRWRYATVNGRKTPLMGLERRRRAERRLFMTGEYP
jgi:lysozyme